MKKSILALAVLGAFAGAASAQSSVTIGGKLDQSVGRPIGGSGTQVMDTAGTPNGDPTKASAGSRLNFGGVEDLGNGMKGVFGMEHRFFPDTGESAATFWNGYSWVGLDTGVVGKLTLGRHYTAAFLGIQNQIDPFAGETVANLRDFGFRTTSATTAAETRVANSAAYTFSAAGATIYATGGKTPAGKTHKPISVAANYGIGPVWVGLGYEQTSVTNAKLTTLGVRYKVGDLTLRGGYNAGTSASDVSIKGYLLGADLMIGGGDLKVGFVTDKVENAPTAAHKKFGIGYHYFLSKRTKVFVDAARDSVPAVNNSGYDLGIQHVF